MHDDGAESEAQEPAMTNRLRRARSDAFALALAAIAVVAPVGAHSPAAAHGCTAPTRPANDQDDLLWQRFLDDVDAFRACISAYADANHRASEVHREAANAATVDWNRFVRAELNVPEDYPWPPEERRGSR